VSGWRSSGGEPSGLQPHSSQKNALRRHYERGQNAQNEANSEVSRFQFEVAGVRSERVRAPRSDFKLQTSHFKLPAQRPHGRGCVQNEAKLGGTGVCGQRLSYGPGLGRGVKRAKRSQFGSRARKWAWARRPGRPARVRLCKTNPIWAGRRANAQNKPNWATREYTLNGVVKGSYGRFACDVPLENKANFSIADWGLGLRRFARNDMIADWRTPAGARRPRRKAQNEPNLARPLGGIPIIPLFRHSAIPIRRRSCKTNPIWPARPGMGAGWRAAMSRRCAIVQNEANSRGQTASMDRASAVGCRPHSRRERLPVPCSSLHSRDGLVSIRGPEPVKRGAAQSGRFRLSATGGMAHVRYRGKILHRRYRPGAFAGCGRRADSQVRHIAEGGPPCARKEPV
jgi:hypothetical protein